MEVSGQLKPGDLVTGRYALVRFIGRGGMGEVWEARHVELDAPVAIKFALERGDDAERFVERFRREARALAKLRSPDLVQIYDVGEHEGAPFLVMELLRGHSLKELLEHTGRLPLARVVELARTVGSALSVIHRAGMVHRDVTPGNVFFVEANDEFSQARAKLLDLGIAKSIVPDSQTTTTGSVIGSPTYMSPEQARAEAVDARSDLWSLAAVMFRALTGRDAFVGRSVTDVLVSVCTDPIPRVSALCSARPTLDAFFERAFARNPVLRMATAHEFVRALEGAASLPAPRPIVPTLAGVPPLARKRHAMFPLLGAASAGALLAVPATLFVATRAQPAPTAHCAEPPAPNRALVVALPPPAAQPQASQAVIEPRAKPATSTAPEPPPRHVAELPVRKPVSMRTVAAARPEPPIDPIFGIPTQKPPR